MNMSYCRFQNTAIDLEDCVEAIENYDFRDDDTSEREKRYAKRIYDLCQRYIEAYEYVKEEFESK